MVRTSPRASYGATDDVTRRARAICTRPTIAILTSTRSAPTQAQTSHKHGHLQATRGHTEVIVSIDPHGRLQAPDTPPLMVWPLVRVPYEPDRRLPVSHLHALRQTRVVKDAAIASRRPTCTTYVGTRRGRRGCIPPSAERTACRISARSSSRLPCPTDDTSHLSSAAPSLLHCAATRRVRQAVQR